MSPVVRSLRVAIPATSPTIGLQRPSIEPSLDDQSFLQRLQRLAPFLCCAVVGVITMPFLPGALLIGWWLASTVIAAVATTLVCIPTVRTHSIVGPLLPASLYIISVAFGRHAVGGSSSGLTVLLLLPVVWVGLVGARRDLAVTLFAAGLAMVVPWAIGDSLYSSADLCRAVLVIAVGMATGSAIQALVTRLRRQSVHLAETIDASLDAIVVCDGYLRILDWNPSAQRLFGITPTTVTTMLDDLLFAGQRPDALVDVLTGVRVPKEPLRTRFDAQITLPDGAQLDVRFGVSVRGVNGATRVHFFAHDLSEEVRGQATTERSERRFRALFESSPIGMALTSPTGELHEANEAFRELTGLHDGTLNEQNVFRLLNDAESSVPEFVAPRRRSTDAMSETVNAYVFESSFRGDSGQTRWGQTHVVSLSSLEARGDEHSELAIQVVDLTERRRSETKLQYLADHDALTGALNRRAFERYLAEHVAQCERYGVTGALVLFDLDGFKHVNDTFGHHAGDEILHSVVTAVTARLRSTDVFARLGGDEFAVLLPTADKASGSVVADAIVSLVGGVRLSTSQSCPVTASVGAVSLGDVLGEHPLPSTDLHDLIAFADYSMYEAKHAGRSAVCWYDPSAHEQPQSRANRVGQLTRAIDESRFELHAMPILDLATGIVEEHELLVRLRTEDGVLRYPNEFLPLAEHSDLVCRIDRWVISEAVSLLGSAVDRDVRCAVNISGRSIVDIELVDELAGLLAAAEVEPWRLTLELTETAAIADLGSAQEFATRLSNVGCGLALDDFGVGFASLSYLKHLPIDVLKIDGDFVRHCLSSNTDRAIIRALVHLARSVGARTIAEFTSDRETLELLRLMGVDGAQGFYVGKPAPIVGGLSSRGHP
jgi:diguanylate cyclase (GGDEF)-like protein/PAS domain S-box-containing protein